MSRSRAIVRGCAALFLLIVLLVGVPLALAHFVGWPLPSGLPSYDAVLTSIQRTGVSDDSVVKALSIIVWLTWARLAVGVVVEAIGLARSRPPVQRRPVGSVQRLAGGLVASVALLAGPAAVHGIPPVGPSVARPTSAAVNAGQRSAPAAITVRRGDTLTSLAAEALGDTTRWPDLWHENSGRRFGSVTFDDPNLILPGWELRLPAPAAARPVAPVAPGSPVAPVAPVAEVSKVADAPAAAISTAPAPAPAPAPKAQPVAMVRPAANRASDDVAAAAPEPGELSATAADPHHDDGVANTLALSLGAMFLVATGTIGAVESRRRRRLRRAPDHARLPLPTRSVMQMERALRALSRPELLTRLDLAVRGAAAALAGSPEHAGSAEHAGAADQSGSVPGNDAARRATALQRSAAVVHAAIIGADGRIELYLSGAAPASAPFTVAELGATSVRWVLPSDVATGDIPCGARFAPFPSPLLVQVGRTDAGELFVDLEATGLLAVDGEGRDAVARGVSAGISVSPFADAASVISVGDAVGDPWTDIADRITLAADADAAVDLAAGLIGPVLGVLRPGDTTFALRSRERGERWEPALLLLDASGLDDAFLSELRAITDPPGRGLGVLAIGGIDGAPWTLRERTGRWRLEPLGIDVDPVGLTREDGAALVELVRFADVAPVVGLPPVVEAQGDSSGELDEPDWTILVRLLGAVDVIDRQGRPAMFERSKSLELVSWLAEHRRGATRSTARAALWETEVRDASFANVVSDARRALARLVPPPVGEEWIGRTLTERLPLHDGVVTDASLLERRLAFARRAADPHSAIEALRPGLELVRDVPFAGTAFLWPDSEGWVSHLMLLVTSAAAELARRSLEVGDADGVFWATGRGLSVIPGHEELIALRMRAHAATGDLAAVRSEWQSYERVLDADTWGDGEPSPKLASLRRELLGHAGEQGHTVRLMAPSPASSGR